MWPKEWPVPTRGIAMIVISELGGDKPKPLPELGSELTPGDRLVTGAGVRWVWGKVGACSQRIISNTNRVFIVLEYLPSSDVYPPRKVHPLAST